MNRRYFLEASVGLAALSAPGTALGLPLPRDEHAAIAEGLWQTMLDAAADLYRRMTPSTDDEAARILVDGAASLKAVDAFKELPLDSQVHPSVQGVMQTLCSKIGESAVFVRALMEEIAAADPADVEGLQAEIEQGHSFLVEWAPSRADRRAVKRFQRAMSARDRSRAAGRLAARLRRLEWRATWEPSSLEATELDPATKQRVLRARSTWAKDKPMPTGVVIGLSIVGIVVGGLLVLNGLAIFLLGFMAVTVAMDGLILVLILGALMVVGGAVMGFFAIRALIRLPDRSARRPLAPSAAGIEAGHRLR
jgi:hypothetical protein